MLFLNLLAVQTAWIARQPTFCVKRFEWSLSPNDNMVERPQQNNNDIDSDDDSCVSIPDLVTQTGGDDVTEVLTDFEVTDDDEKSIDEGGADQEHDWIHWWSTDIEVIETRRRAVIMELVNLQRSIEEARDVVKNSLRPGLGQETQVIQPHRDVPNARSDTRVLLRVTLDTGSD